MARGHCSWGHFSALGATGLPTSVFSNWIQKGFVSLSHSPFVARPIPVTPTRTPVPTHLSEKNECASGTSALVTSNWVWRLETGLIIFNWAHRSRRKHRLILCRSCLDIRLQVQSEIALWDFQEITLFSTLFFPAVIWSCSLRLSH